MSLITQFFLKKCYLKKKSNKKMQKYKLGIHDIFIVSKYLETIKDFENIERATKKAKDLTYKFKFNPIELDDYSRKLFKNIETFHVFKKESNHFEKDEFYQRIIWYPVLTYEQFKTNKRDDIIYKSFILIRNDVLRYKLSSI